MVEKPKPKNSRGLTPISYEIYRKLRAFKYKTRQKILWKPQCYKDGKRIKFCMWACGRDKWEEYAKSLGLRKGTHYTHEYSAGRGGFYPTTILYLE